MFDVIVLRDETVGAEALAGPIGMAFSCCVRQIAEVSEAEARNASVVMIYSELRRQSDIDRIAALYSPSFRITNMIYVAPSLERAGIVQAEAIGLGRIFAAHHTIDDIRRGVRDILNRELGRRLTRFNRAVLKAVETTDGLHNTLAAAMRAGKPLPLSGLRSSSDAIASAVRQEGLATWINAVKCHHSQTSRHVMNVAGLAGGFANHLGLDRADTALLIEASLLHDVGKLFIPISILEKPGRLTDAERATINVHPQRGAEALIQSGVEDKLIVSAARSHHEYLDGSGYPDKHRRRCHFAARADPDHHRHLQRADRGSDLSRAADAATCHCRTAQAEAEARPAPGRRVPQDDPRARLRRDAVHAGKLAGGSPALSPARPAPPRSRQPAAGAASGRRLGRLTRRPPGDRRAQPKLERARPCRGAREP